MASEEFEDLEELTEEELKALQKSYELSNAAYEALENAPFDTEITFRCPLCGGAAHAGKSSYNGHKHASCDQCKIAFRQ